jgi:hypothetical protein
MNLLHKYRNFYASFNEEIKEWKQKDRSINIDVNDAFSRIIKENIMYVRYDDVVNSIRSKVSKLDKSKPFYLFFPTEYPFKIGSENAFILEIYDDLLSLNIVEVINGCNFEIQSASEKCNVIIIDDCIYTGKNISHIISTLTAKFQNIKFEFFVITFGSNLIAEEKIRNEINSNCTINFMNDIHLRSFIEVISQYVNTSITNDLLRISNGLLAEVPLLYFDHKIHDSLVEIISKDMFNNDCYPCNIPSLIIKHVR